MKEENSVHAVQHYDEPNVWFRSLVTSKALFGLQGESMGALVVACHHYV